MRAELARDRPKRAGRPTGRPRPITIGPAWVVVCFAGERPRFLARELRAGWAVKLSPLEAHRFEDAAAAQQALEDFQRRHAGSSFEAGSAWCVKQMTLTATFG